MCYQPTKRTATLIDRAAARVREGKLQEASRLLEAARTQMGPVVNIQWQGKRVGDWYREAAVALQNAQRGVSKTLRLGDL